MHLWIIIIIITVNENATIKIRYRINYFCLFFRICKFKSHWIVILWLTARKLHSQIIVNWWRFLNTLNQCDSCKKIICSPFLHETNNLETQWKKFHKLRVKKNHYDHSVTADDFLDWRCSAECYWRFVEIVSHQCPRRDWGEMVLCTDIYRFPPKKFRFTNNAK